MKSILVPVDYSEPSADVLRYAAEIAQRTGATLTVLHVWECMPHAPPDLMVKGRDGKARKLGDVIKDNAERDMTQFLERVTLPQDVAIERRVESGEAARCILSQLTSGKYDLIVMGTHGRGGVEHLMLGSVAEKVTRSSPVPVITVPAPKAERG